MVTNEEMLYFDTKHVSGNRCSMRVTAGEMKHFDREKQELSLMIGDKKIAFQKANGLKASPAYDVLEEKCQISITRIKSAIAGKETISRRFLYKFAVGLEMTLDEANHYFRLQGGELSEDNKEDYICINALRDKDDIYHFVDEFEAYTGYTIALNKKGK